MNRSLQLSEQSNPQPPASQNQNCRLHRANLRLRSPPRKAAQRGPCRGCHPPRQHHRPHPYLDTDTDTTKRQRPRRQLNSRHGSDHRKAKCRSLGFTNHCCRNHRPGANGRSAHQQTRTHNRSCDDARPASYRSKRPPASDVSHPHFAQSNPGRSSSTAGSARRNPARSSIARSNPARSNPSHPSPARSNPTAPKPRCPTSAVARAAHDKYLPRRIRMANPPSSRCAVEPPKKPSISLDRMLTDARTPKTDRPEVDSPAPANGSPDTDSIDLKTFVPPSPLGNMALAPQVTDSTTPHAPLADAMPSQQPVVAISTKPSSDMPPKPTPDVAASPNRPPQCRIKPQASPPPINHLRRRTRRHRC